MKRNGRQLHMGCGECLSNRYGARTQQTMSHAGFRVWLEHRSGSQPAVKSTHRSARR